MLNRLPMMIGLVILLVCVHVIIAQQIQAENLEQLEDRLTCGLHQIDIMLNCTTEELTNLIAALGRENEELRADLSTAVLTLETVDTELRANITTLEGTDIDLRSNITTLRDADTDLRANIITLEGVDRDQGADISTLGRVDTELRADITTLGGTVSGIMNENQRLHATISSQSSQIRNVMVSMRRLTDLSRTVRQAGTESREMGNKIALLEHRVGMSDASDDWIVNDFSLKQAAAASGSNEYIRSPSFYTHRNGYKMELKLYPNGDSSGSGTHVSLYPNIARGPHDSRLSWPFRLRLEITIVNVSGGSDVTFTLNPTSSCSGPRWTRPTSARNLGCGRHQLLSHRNLAQYLKQDRMIVSVKILR